MNALVTCGWVWFQITADVPIAFCSPLNSPLPTLLFLILFLSLLPLPCSSFSSYLISAGLLNPLVSFTGQIFFPIFSQCVATRKLSLQVLTLWPWIIIRKPYCLGFILVTLAPREFPLSYRETGSRRSWLDYSSTPSTERFILGHSSFMHWLSWSPETFVGKLAEAVSVVTCCAPVPWQVSQV